MTYPPNQPGQPPVPGNPGQPPAPGTPGQVPPGQYSAVPPKSDGKKSKGLIYGLLAVLVAVIVVVALLIWRPWTSDSASEAATETFTLAHDIEVTTTVPAGWKAVMITDDDDTVLAIVPEDETRTSNDALQQASSALESDANAKPVHAVLAMTEECPSSVADLGLGQWQTKDVLSATKNGATTDRYPAIYRVNATYCMQVVGVDIEHGSSVQSHQGVDTAKSLIDNKEITAAMK